MGAARPQDGSLAEVERNRLRLEDNVTKLRISLQHWQTWEAEYEGLQEEIEAFGGDATAEDVMEIGRNFGSDLVNEREIKELVRYGKSTQRTGKQVVELLSRRIDYVQQNIRTVHKQVDAAEEKLSSLPTVTIPDMQSDEGLPMTEIHEELDEEGNLLSSTISHPGQAAPEIVQALRQAGVTDLETPKLNEGPLQYKVGADGSRQDAEQSNSDTTDSIAAKAALPESSSEKKPHDASQAPAKTAKKTVAFAESTKTAAPAPVPIPTPTAPSGPASHRFGPELAKGSFHKGSRVIELDENDQEIGSTPIVPLNESPEDAARRREMLEYSLSEVGAVVAELDLEDDGESSHDDDDYEVDEHWEDESGEEDEYGRSLRPGVSDECRKEMLELEKKLNAKMLENIGPRPNDPALEEAVKSAHRLVVQKDKSVTVTLTEPAAEPETKPAKKSASKKGVRFADELDISPAPTPAPKSEPLVNKNLTERPVMSDIVERSSANVPPPSTSPPKKTSRFKATRTSATPPTPPSPSFTIPDRTKSPVPSPTTDATDLPTFPFKPNEILTSSILERPPTSTSRAIPAAPDENVLDPALLQRETAAAYHRMRNRMIQQQGGFLASEKDKLEEEERGPLLEERDGRVRKVSRFRAARLGGGGV